MLLKKFFYSNTVILFLSNGVGDRNSTLRISRDMNWYQVLGLEEGATLKEIKTAYRREVKKYHPDVSDHTLNDHMRMIRLNRAYYTLRKKLDAPNIIFPLHGAAASDSASPVGSGAAEPHPDYTEAGAGRTASNGSGGSRNGAAEQGYPGAGAGGVGTHSAAPPGVEQGVPLNTTAVESYKDPGYAYYKLGFAIFSRIHPSAFWSSTKDLFDVWVNRVRDRDAAKIVEKMIESFPKAYYYFSVVVDEYPDSIWAPDSIEKMNKIEKMTPLYAKILTSFHRC